MNPHEEANIGNNAEDECGIAPAVEEPQDLLSRGLVPKLLKKSAGREKCCIFRIPERLESNNHMAYEPRVVSFGPYHHGKPHLQMIQEHKHRFLGFFMSEAKKKGVDAKDLIEAVSKLVEDIRDSYSESLYNDDDLLGRKKLIEMMVLDGCFILMLFLAVAGRVRYYEIENDPIFVIPWILPAIRSDLLLLENQVPFFLLQTILKRSKIEESTSGLNKFTFNFFNYALQKPNEFWLKHHKLEANHILDLIRKIFMPDIPKEEKEANHLLDMIRKFCMRREDKKELDVMLEKGKQELHSMLEKGKQEVDSMLRKGKQELDSMLNKGKQESKLEKEKQELDSMLEEGKLESDSLEEEDLPPRPFLKLILSARKLQLKGIKFKPRKNAETLLDIRHKGKHLQIPPLILDDFLISVFLNCVAFEQFYAYCKKHITSYVAFMGCLLKSEADAMFLSEEGILENYFGSGDEVSRFFKVVGKDISFDIDESYLADVFEGVNKYTSQGWHVQMAGFMHTHFDSPWTALSSCAALTLLILTIIQAFFAVYGYYHPRK